MTENMKAFIEKVNNTPALKAELEAVSKQYEGKKEAEINKNELATKTAEIAAKYGFTLTEQDMKPEKTELSPEELEAVAGGKGGGCGCPVAGGGGGFEHGGYCACFAAGMGYGDDGNGNQMERCVCPFAGAGWD